MIFFDLETGGVEDKHPTIQIAAIAVDGNFAERDTFERKIRFDASLADPEALELNCYDAAVWDQEAVEPSGAFGAFADFCGRHKDLTLISKRTGKPYSVARIGGHNVASFDIPRVRRGLDRLGEFWPACWWYPLDTYQGAIWHVFTHALEPPTDYRLETLRDYFHIDVAGDAHDALTDVRIAAQIARRISLVESL